MIVYNLRPILFLYSKEDVERCKQKDLLAEILAEMTGDFPEIYEIIVKERDAYLARSLRLAAIPREVTEPDGGTNIQCPITLYKHPRTGSVIESPGLAQDNGRIVLSTRWRAQPFKFEAFPWRYIMRNFYMFLLQL